MLSAGIALHAELTGPPRRLSPEAQARPHSAARRTCASRGHRSSSGLRLPASISSQDRTGGWPWEHGERAAPSSSRRCRRRPPAATSRPSSRSTRHWVRSRSQSRWSWLGQPEPRPSYLESEFDSGLPRLLELQVERTLCPGQRLIFSLRLPRVQLGSLFTGNLKFKLYY